MTDLSSFSLSLVFSMGDIDQISEGNVLQRVACLADLFVNFITPTDTVTNMELGVL